MEKLEFKSKAGKEVLETSLSKTDCYIFYIAYNFRWEETADPIYGDIEFFFTEDEAKKHLEKNPPEIGFTPKIDKVYVSGEDLEDAFEDDDDFELKDIEIKDRFEIFEGAENDGEDLEGAIVVEWSWEKYIGYARNLHGIRVGLSGETDNSINTGNLERTWRHNESVLLPANEIEGLSVEELREKVTEALNSGYWKWNYFKNNPDTVDIDSFIETYF